MDIVKTVEEIGLSVQSGLQRHSKSIIMLVIFFGLLIWFNSCESSNQEKLSTTYVDKQKLEDSVASQMELKNPYLSNAELKSNIDVQITNLRKTPKYMNLESLTLRLSSKVNEYIIYKYLIIGGIGLILCALFDEFILYIMTAIPFTSVFLANNKDDPNSGKLKASVIYLIGIIFVGCVWFLSELIKVGLKGVIQ